MRAYQGLPHEFYIDSLVLHFYADCLEPDQLGRFEDAFMNFVVQNLPTKNGCIILLSLPIQ